MFEEPPMYSEGRAQMLSKRIQDAFNQQINAEIYSSYLYFSMSNYFEARSLKGMANWMKIQAQEELIHVSKFCSFTNERGGRVILTQVEGPKTDWKSPLEAFEDALHHERKVTGLINGLIDLAIAESDHAANTFVQWFVTEQVEEEATVQEIVDNLKLAGDTGAILFMLDKELGQRTLPSTTATA
jgi:ferritin